MDGPVLAHELEPLDGIVFVSRANQAAAFDRISRSSLSCLFSRRSRTSSSRTNRCAPALISGLFWVSVRVSVDVSVRHSLVQCVVPHGERHVEIKGGSHGVIWTHADEINA